MKTLFKKIWRIVWISLLVFIGSTLLSALIFRFIPVPFTPLMLIRCTQQLSEGHGMKMTKSWTPITKISPNMVLAVIASEDNRFMEHHGFDFEAIEKAMEYNQKKHGKKMRGASTISQQTAKNVFLWPGRSWLRKGLETYFTVLIEMVWGKERIMEVYLNIIETGEGVYGCEGAAKAFFGKSPARLGMSEAALIATVLPNPRKMNLSAPSIYMRRRQAAIMWNMMNIGEVHLSNNKTSVK